MAAKSELVFDIIANDKASKTFDKVGDAAEGTGRKAGGPLSKALGLAAAGFAVAGAAAVTFAAYGVKSAMDVESGLREVNTLLGNTGPAAEKSFGELQKGVADLSKEVGIAQTTLTDGLYTAISAGVPKENAFTFLRDAAKLGIAGVADTETAVNALTGVLNAFKKDALSSEQAADILFTTVKQGKTTLAELAPAIGTVGPAAAAAGVSFRDTAAALATVTKIIPNTATAASSLRQVFAEADKSGTKFNDSLKTLGAQTMGEAVEKFGSFQAVLQKVYEGTGSSDVAFKNLFGSVEAGGAALTLVGTNAATAAADLEAMNQATGASNAAFEEMEKSVSRQWENIKVQFQNLAIEVGNVLLPHLSRLATWLLNEGVPALNRFVDWVKANKEGFVDFGANVATVTLAIAEAVFRMVQAAATGMAGLVTVMGRVGVASFDMARVILSAFEAALGWLPGYRDKFDQAQAVLAAFGTVAKLKSDQAASDFRAIADGAGTAARGVQSLRDRIAEIQSKRVTVTVDYNQNLGGLTPRQADRIPGRAVGGPVSAFRPYWVGERGPELMVPERNGRVLTAEQSRQLTSSGASQVAGSESGSATVSWTLVLPDMTVLARGVNDVNLRNGRR